MGTLMRLHTLGSAAARRACGLSDTGPCACACAYAEVGPADEGPGGRGTVYAPPLGGSASQECVKRQLSPRQQLPLGHEMHISGDFWPWPRPPPLP